MIKSRIIFILALMIVPVSICRAQDSTYSAFSRQNYYTDEQEGEVAVFVPESKSNMRITVDLAFEFGFLSRGQLVFPGHLVPCAFPLDRFHEGINEVTVSFYENEKWVDSRKVNVEIRKGVFNAVKVDRLTGTLVVDGLPFYPIGFYCNWPVTKSFLDEEVVKGFNLVSPYWKIDNKGH